jgi:hypothetical protein
VKALKRGSVMGDAPAPMRAAVNLPPGGANAIMEATRELPYHARGQFRKDLDDLLRSQLSPVLEDVAQGIAMARDLARRRGAFR